MSQPQPPASPAFPSAVHRFLFAVGTAFGRTFLSTFITVIPAVLDASNQDDALALAIAALAACVGAALASIKEIIPGFTWGTLVPQPLGGWLDAFTIAFLAYLVTFWSDWFNTPDWSGWHTALIAAATGALSAGLRALQGRATKGESPAPAKGI